MIPLSMQGGIELDTQSPLHPPDQSQAQTRNPHANPASPQRQRESPPTQQRRIENGSSRYDLNKNLAGDIGSQNNRLISFDHLDFEIVVKWRVFHDFEMGTGDNTDPP